MKTTNYLRTTLTLAALALVANTASADVAISATAATDTKPTITYNGTLERAYNFGLGAVLNTGGAVTTLLYDGITFTNIQTTGNHPNATWSVYAGDTTGIQIASGAGQYNTGSLGADDLWFKALWTSSNAALVMNITGLDSSKAYEFKVLYGEPRSVPQSYDTYSDDVTISDGVNSASVALSFGDGIGDYASTLASISGTSSATFTMGNANGGPGLSAVLISEVPVISDPKITAISVDDITDQATMTFTGAASTTYVCKSTTDLLGFPTTEGVISGSLTTDPSGDGSVVVDATGAEKFYRLEK